MISFQKLLFIFFAWPISASGLAEEEIDIVLNNSVPYAYHCKYFVEIKNNTRLNFSRLAIKYVARDGKGIIVEKNDLVVKLMPGSSSIESAYGECIGSVEFTQIDPITLIDNELIQGDFKNQVMELPIKSKSNASDVSVKSAGGILK